MNADAGPEAVLGEIAGLLAANGRPHALVGGLAVSLRAEVRFTRDVDLAILATDDADVEGLVFTLRAAGYVPVATVEHVERGRLATVRLAAPAGVVVDLLAASSGIEAEIVARATPVDFGGEVGRIPVARAEELLAMKVLSMTDRRLQDRIDAINLVLLGDGLDLDAVRSDLAEITRRGFHGGQDLLAKLEAVLREAAER